MSREEYEAAAAHLDLPDGDPTGGCCDEAGAAIRGYVGELEREVERLRAHVLDIQAHATPYADIPDDPGYVGTYLLTAGALHRALGTIGHTMPSCQAEVEVARLRTLLAEHDIDPEAGS